MVFLADASLILILFRMFDALGQIIDMLFPWTFEGRHERSNESEWENPTHTILSTLIPL
jgi:hypothetical protein